jgi:hypothetical protein
LAIPISTLSRPEANGWAMLHAGYMGGFITAT